MPAASRASAWTRSNRAGVPLKRLYQLYPGGKGELVIAYLAGVNPLARALTAHARRARSRTTGARGLRLARQAVRRARLPRLRLSTPRRVGPTVPAVAQAVRDHKLAFRRYVSELVAEAGHPATVAHAVYLLAEGAIVTAGIDQQTEAAVQARQGAALLLRVG